MDNGAGFPIRKKPMAPSGHQHALKLPCETFSSFCSSHPSPKVSLPPINNQESMTPRLPDTAAPRRSPARANGFYFYISGENHVAAFDNTHKGKKIKKAPALRSPLPLHLLLRQTSDKRPAAPSARHLLAFG